MPTLLLLLSHHPIEGFFFYLLYFIEDFNNLITEDLRLFLLFSDSFKSSESLSSNVICLDLLSFSRLLLSS